MSAVARIHQQATSNATPAGARQGDRPSSPGPSWLAEHRRSAQTWQGSQVATLAALSEADPLACSPATGAPIGPGEPAACRQPTWPDLPTSCQPATPDGAGDVNREPEAATEPSLLDPLVQRAAAAATWAGDRVGDALNWRPDEALLDAQEASLREKTDFIDAEHRADDFHFGTGMFDAIYDPASATLRVELKVSYFFLNGADPGLIWNDASKEHWKAQWRQQVEAAWSAQHTFACQRPGWEDLRAGVQVEVLEVTDRPHFLVTVENISADEFHTSSVLPARPGTPSTRRQPGNATLDSEDIHPVDKSSGKQLGGVHEAGHMLGLGDEYGKGCHGQPTHAAIAPADPTLNTTCGDDGRVMSTGMEVGPAHGLTFLAALRAATGIPTWAMEAKATPAAPVSP